MSKKKTKKQEAKTGGGELSLKLEQLDIAYWRNIARALTGETDQWEVGKVATALKLQTDLLAKNYNDMKRIANREDGKLSVGWSWKIDGEAIPPTIKVSGSFSEKHSMKSESDVPSEDQLDLPGVADAEPEEESPRVHSAEEQEAQ